MSLLVGLNNRFLGDPALNDLLALRGGMVEVYLNDGTVLKQHTRFPPGTKENPFSTEALSAKARDLIGPVLGKAKTESVISKILNLEKMKDVNQFIALISSK